MNVPDISKIKRAWYRKGYASGRNYSPPAGKDKEVAELKAKLNRFTSNTNKRGVAPVYSSNALKQGTISLP